MWGTNWSKINQEQPESDSLVYVRPRRITFFDDKNIVFISSIVANYFALSSDGLVYKFSDDNWIRDSPPDPILLDHNYGIDKRIKWISTSQQFSIAMSTDGTLYSLSNSLADLTLKKEPHEMSMVSQQLPDVKVDKIVTGGFNIFILDDQGYVHYSEGAYPDCKFFSIESEQKFIDICVDDNQVLCQTDEQVYVFKYQNGLIETKNINFFEYYLQEYNATNEMIRITNDGYLEIAELSTEQGENVLKWNQLYLHQDKLDEQYKVVKQVGEGGFGKVFVVEKVNQPDKQYALKWISIEGRSKIL